MAAADAKRQLLDVASAQMNVPASRLDLREGKIADRENPVTAKTVAEVMSELRHGFGVGDREQNMIIGKGWRGPNDDDVTVRSWGAQFAEVEVDTETGEVRVTKIVAAHEVGRVVNPLSATSQVEGGIIQGMGFALFEERVLNDASGRIVNANLHDYKIPSALDIPEIEAIFVDMPDEKVNNAGVKGLGEPPIIPTAAAIANAVTDAIGVRVPYAPMTPKRVLDALGMGGRRA
jgi:xanthine dehydrogenase YagR molybdenum-binding subunit